MTYVWLIISLLVLPMAFRLFKMSMTYFSKMWPAMAGVDKNWLAMSWNLFIGYCLFAVSFMMTMVSTYIIYTESKAIFKSLL